jgi:hypothetical protein
MPGPTDEDLKVQMAVTIERLHVLSKEMSQQLMRRDEQFDELKQEIITLKKHVDNNGAMLNRAKGGYMVILGLGALLSWATDLWQKIFKLFS